MRAREHEEMIAIVRISNYELGSGAIGIRIPDLLHAISRQHVHLSTSLQVTVLARPPRYAVVRLRCGTSVLYSESSRNDPPANEPGAYLDLPTGDHDSARPCRTARNGRPICTPTDANANSRDPSGPHYAQEALQEANPPPIT